MDSLILDSIKEITYQRDIDTLEYALAATLARFIPSSIISLYRSSGRNLNNYPVEVLHTFKSVNNSGEYHVNNENLIKRADGYLVECLKTAAIVRYETLDGSRNILYPVFIDKKIAGVIHIASQHDFSTLDNLIESLTHIYSNYMTVLNDAERDKLTGLLNRRTFDNRLNKLLDYQRAKQQSYMNAEEDEKRHYTPDINSWLAMLDIDHFKLINDNYGHLFGDEVILTLSHKMKDSFRYTDLLFRFGGEEFVIILEPTTAKDAKRIFERFGKKIAEHIFPQIGKITISIGYVKISINDYQHAILERADRALYYAKENGRNCVFNYDELVAKGYLSERQTKKSAVFFDED